MFARVLQQVVDAMGGRAPLVGPPPDRVDDGEMSRFLSGHKVPGWGNMIRICDLSAVHSVAAKFLPDLIDTWVEARVAKERAAGLRLRKRCKLSPEAGLRTETDRLRAAVQALNGNPLAQEAAAEILRLFAEREDRAAALVAIRSALATLDSSAEIRELPRLTQRPAPGPVLPITRGLDPRGLERLFDEVAAITGAPAPTNMSDWLAIARELNPEERRRVEDAADAIRRGVKKYGLPPPRPAKVAEPEAVYVPKPPPPEPEPLSPEEEAALEAKREAAADEFEKLLLSAETPQARLTLAQRHREDLRELQRKIKKQEEARRRDHVERAAEDAKGPKKSTG